MTAAIANSSAPNTIRSATGWNASWPGRSTTSTPRKQIASAPARVAVMRSPRNSTASSVTQAGMMNSSANTVANGSTAMPMVQQICEPKCTTLRPSCRPMWRHWTLRNRAGEASPIASRITSPPKLRTVIISNALK